MKEIWPSEDNCIKLRDNFAPCEIGTSMCEIFAHPQSSCLPKAISSSFQLQIIHGLKRWILDFQSFEMVYSMQKMDLGKFSKSTKEDYSCRPLFSLLCFPLSIALSLHTLNDFGKGLQSSKAWFFMNLSSQKLCHELYAALPHS